MISSRLRQRMQPEGVRQEIFQAIATGAIDQDHSFRAREFGQQLAAGAARHERFRACGGLVVRRIDTAHRDGVEMPVAGQHRGDRGRALGANRQPVRGVFHVRPGKNLTTGENRRPHMKIRVRAISLPRGLARGGDQRFCQFEWYFRGGHFLFGSPNLRAVDTRVLNIVARSVINKVPGKLGRHQLQELVLKGRLAHAGFN